jgi:hypothetical protein
LFWVYCRTRERRIGIMIVENHCLILQTIYDLGSQAVL